MQMSRGKWAITGCATPPWLQTPKQLATYARRWIGIGGSGLGPLLMVRALQNPGVGLPFHFLDNVDPEGFSRSFATLGPRLATTLVKRGL